MIDLRGHINLPEYGMDADDKITVTRDEIENLVTSIRDAAEGWITICLHHWNNGQRIIFLADFGNHGLHKIAALKEIESLLRPFEERLPGALKAHIFAHDDETDRTVDMRFGEPYSPKI
ncbi:hypothetical protein ACLBKT_11690 [Erythrobacter sp. W302b]|uniref:hypothetical protein n=1 Tax=Erythrobacter sp. W302b TaxID=3389874 RepID=UPI00396B21A6